MRRPAVRFDPDEFLTLAKELADRDGGEADRRTAVSRAYYVVFWRARLQRRFPSGESRD
jgi:hypothetical protein